MIGTPCEVPEPRKMNENAMKGMEENAYENSLSKSA
jgi:hypothetical protein